MNALEIPSIEAMSRTVMRDRDTIYEVPAGTQLEMQVQKRFYKNFDTLQELFRLAFHQLAIRASYIECSMQYYDPTDAILLGINKMTLHTPYATFLPFNTYEEVPHVDPEKEINMMFCGLRISNISPKPEIIEMGLSLFGMTLYQQDEYDTMSLALVSSALADTDISNFIPINN